MAGRPPRRAGRARAWAPRAGGDRRGGEPRCAAGAARREAGPPDPNTTSAGARSAGAVRRALLPRYEGRALAAPLHVRAGRDRRRARPTGVPDRRASGQRDLRRRRAPRRVRPGCRRSGGGRRQPRLADTAGLLPALPGPPKRPRERPELGTGDRRARARGLAPARSSERSARQLLTRTSPVSGSERHSGSRPRPHGS